MGLVCQPPPQRGLAVYVLNGELMTDILFESQTLYEAFSFANVQDEWTVGFAQHGVDTVNTNVTVCSGLTGGQSQLQIK